MTRCELGVYDEPIDAEALAIMHQQNGFRGRISTIIDILDGWEINHPIAVIFIDKLPFSNRLDEFTLEKVDAISAEGVLMKKLWLDGQITQYFVTIQVRS